MREEGPVVMKSGTSQQTVSSEDGNIFMGAVTENDVAQQLIEKGYDLFYWERIEGAGRKWLAPSSPSQEAPQHGASCEGSFCMGAALRTIPFPPQ